MKDQVAGLKEKGVKVEMLYEKSPDGHLKYVSACWTEARLALMIRSNIRSRWGTQRSEYYI